jgi:RNA polymerase sigma-70 factor (ECF subfamily)
MAEPSDARADADALAADIAERYLPRLRMFALRRLRVLAEAEDAAQETLRRVLIALREGRVTDIQALPAYVFETARHICAHHIRHVQRTERAHSRLADTDPVPSSTADPLSTLISSERLRQVRAALAELAPADRELLRLTYVEGLTAEAIAARLALTTVNVRVRRHRLQKQLARTLGVTPAARRAPESEAK